MKEAFGGAAFMSLTITLSDELVQRLRAQATAQRLSVQQWALAILSNASQRPEDTETWIDLNSRRVALIRKRYEAGLTESEEEELGRLQAAAADILEPFDRQRLEHIRSLVKNADEPEIP
jgi:hypothetical protein